MNKPVSNKKLVLILISILFAFFLVIVGVTVAGLYPFASSLWSAYKNDNQSWIALTETLSFDDVQISEEDLDDQYRIIVDFKELEPRDFQVEVRNGILYIKAFILTVKEEDGARSEYQSQIERSFSLPHHVDPQNFQVNQEGNKFNVNFNVLDTE